MSLASEVAPHARRREALMLEKADGRKKMRQKSGHKGATAARDLPQQCGDGGRRLDLRPAEPVSRTAENMKSKPRNDEKTH